MKNKLYLVMLTFLLIFCLTGCTMFDDSDKTIEDKSNSELAYVEDEIFLIANKYAKDEYLKSGIIDWNSILKDSRKINNVVDTMLLDLSELEISNEDIIEFSNELDNLVIIISERNEILLIDKLNYLHSLIPKYMSYYSTDVNAISKKELKNLVLSSYNFANMGNWSESKTAIQNAEDKYKKMMNDVEYMKQNSYNLNKVYVLIEELKNAINHENIELVKMKYINTIEAII